MPPGREIRVTEESGEIDDLTFSLKKQARFYVFTINGFPTEDTAKHYVNNVWAGLMWVLLHRGLPPDAVLELGKVVYTEDPNQAAKNLGLKGPVDGFIDGAWPAVYPTNNRLRTATVGQITPLQTYSAGDVLNVSARVLSFQRAPKS